MVTQILTWKHLFVRTRFDRIIDPSVTRLIRGFVFLTEEGAFWFSAVDEILSDVARLEMREVGRGRKVCAARDGDGAEPGFIGVGAIVTVAGQGILGGRGRVTGNLLEGFGEVLVGFVGVGVVGEG